MVLVYIGLDSRGWVRFYNLTCVADFLIEMRSYAFTIFLGAFLLFQIEPIVAKFILPWFGGAPTVWTTCLLFFQMLLLAGYTYAHLIDARLSPRRQMMIHLALVALCILAMSASAISNGSPIMPGAQWKPVRADNPMLRILFALSVSIGLPFFVLSATAPLLQSWYARVGSASPYRLYSVSNLGSLLALLTYPFVIEPNFSLGTQAALWSALYGLFAIAMVVCAWPLRHQDVSASESQEAVEVTGTGARALWILLPACASVLLYAATTQMTQDIAPIPFLWILPLALYLLSFVFCFDNDRWYRRGIFQPLLGIAIVTSFVIIVYVDRIALALGHRVLSPTTVSLLLQTGNVSLLMFAGCMVCHGELARLRPHQRDLTRFFLMVSAGGAIGGIFSAIVAPLVFRGFWEGRLAIWMTTILMTIAPPRDRGPGYIEGTPSPVS